MKRYGRVAAEAVENYLHNHADEPAVQLYTISCVADRAAFDAGRKSDLYDGLYGYLALLPPGTRSQWTGDDRGGVYVVLNPFNPDSATVKAHAPMAGLVGDVPCVDMGPSPWPRLPVSMDGAR